jgi:alpha/beta superfamily hydrolase
MTQSAVTFPSADGLDLEGRLAAPDSSPAGVAVLCHPYPPAGGTMSSIVIPRLARGFVAAGWAALRFNFRGVGQSEGSFAGGVEEKADVAGALAFVRSEYPGVPSAVAGWSFGAIVALQAAIEDRELAAYVGIAPPLTAGGAFAVPPLPDPIDWMARRMLVAGDQDPVCALNALTEAALRLNAEVRLIRGADHAFSGHLDELTDTVVTFVTA